MKKEQPKRRIGFGADNEAPSGRIRLDPKREETRDGEREKLDQEKSKT